MSTELKILAVPKDTNIPEVVQAKLAEANIVVLRCPSPELVRLVTPSQSIDILPANEFMWAALDALSMTGTQSYNEPDAHKLRTKFVGNLVKVSRRPLIGWSAKLPNLPTEEEEEEASRG